MTSRDFCYWLQGFLELKEWDGQSMNQKQMQVVAKHLNLVFLHEIDPSFGDKKEQDKLNKVHNGSETSTVLVRC